jgi:hypothetical protein
MLMNQADYKQTQCPRCGTAAWSLPAQAVPCNACGSPVPAYGAPPPPMPFQAGAPMPYNNVGPAPAANGIAPPGAQNPWSPQPMQPVANPIPQINIPGVPSAVSGMGNKLLNKMPGSIRMKAILLVVVVLAAGIVAVVLKVRKGPGTAKGNIAYASLSLDRDHADPDQMITALAGKATGWKKDAVWWSINVIGLRSDGTVNLGDGGTAKVTYISPDAVQSLVKKVRKDSLKEYNLGMAGVRSDMMVGADEPWKGVRPPALPSCSIKQVAALMADKGLVKGKTIRVNFDPQFARMSGAPDVDSWHVVGEDPKIDMWLSMTDCAVTKG